MKKNVKHYLAACDPGKTGCLVLLDNKNNIIELADMPILTWNGKKEIVFVDNEPTERYKQEWEFDRSGIFELLESWKLIYGVDIIYVEKLNVRPQVSGHSAFTMGLGVAYVLMAATALNLEIKEVAPAKWKKEMKVTDDKKSSFNMVKNLYPDSNFFKNVTSHHNRSEAVLIGRYGLIREVK